MRIVLLGLPGAGKGTQGKLLARYLKIPHVSLGDCVREILKTDTSLANEIRSTHSERWVPLPDLLAIKIYQSFAQVDCVLDGFPRNIEQLNMFNIQETDRFIYLDISEETSRDRILKRHRSDDALLRWEERIKVERQRLPELIAKSRAIRVWAEQDTMQVFGEIKNELSI